MGVLVYILGRPGTGKSRSMKGFDSSKIGVINAQGKILPFEEAGEFDVVNTDNSSEIVDHIKIMSKKYKTIVVDDYQYVMSNEFMRRSAERGYDKFTEIARHAWDIADCVRTLPNDVIVYIMCHTDTDQDGFEKLKTIGKLLDEKIILEGMSTVVLKTSVSDGQYMFLTQNNGKDTVKSPEGMFPSYAIDNNLKYVDEKIRSYYKLGEYKTKEEMADQDAAVTHEVSKEKKRRRGKEEEKPTEAPKEEEKAAEPTAEEPAEDRPKRSRRKAAEEAIAEAGTTDDGEPVEFNEQTVELPQRKERAEEVEEPEEEAPRRRRRRA